MKLIFSDILIAKKINSYNDVIYLFEGAIYLHLLDSKWLKILRRLESNLYEDIHYWISDYYINIWNLNFALNELNKKKLTKKWGPKKKQ